LPDTTSKQPSSLGCGRTTRFSTTPKSSIEARIFFSVAGGTTLAFHSAGRSCASGI